MQMPEKLLILQYQVKIMLVELLTVMEVFQLILKVNSIDMDTIMELMFMDILEVIA